MTFVSGSFDALSSRATAEGRLLVLDFTASWCAPCRAMEAKVWPDPRVSAWIDAHALALRVDVDVEKTLAARFGVRSLPSIVVLRGETELDRRSGSVSVATLVGWLEGLLAGRTLIDQLREAARGNDVRAHHDLGKALVERGDRGWSARARGPHTGVAVEDTDGSGPRARADDFDGALEELVWVWQNALAHEPAYYGVRHSFLVEQLRSLAARHVPARERIARLRDDAGAAALGAPPTQSALSDWGSLSRASGDASSILEWFDSLGGVLPDGVHIGTMQLTFRQLVDTPERRAALGRMYPPAAEIVAEAEALRARILASPEMPDETNAEIATSVFRHQLAEARASYVAAGRDDDVRVLDEAERVTPE